MSKSGVNWRAVYEIFVIAQVIVGLIVNQSFREWLLHFVLITVILAVVIAFDHRNIR